MTVAYGSQAGAGVSLVSGVLPNDEYLKRRDTGGTAHDLIGINASNEVVVGNIDAGLVSSLIVRATQTVELRAGTVLDTRLVLSDAADTLTLTLAGNIAVLIGTTTASFQGLLISSTLALAIGNVPATSGQIRLANAGGGIRSLNNAGNANIQMIAVGAADVIQIGENGNNLGVSIIATAANTIILVVGAATIGTWSATGLALGTLAISGVTTLTASTAIIIGATPATAGTIRLANTSSILIRNAGNTANLNVLNIDANNDFNIGDANVRDIVIDGADGRSIFVNGAMRDVNFIVSSDTNANALVVDGAGGGNVGVGGTGWGTNAVGVLGLYNNTAPTTSPADMVQLFSTDASGAGTASLGIRTEEAVAAEVIAASTHVVRITWNGTMYKFLLSNV